MKKSILFVVLVLAVNFFALAAPPDVPNSVSSAFKNAGLPLLGNKRPIIDFSLRRVDGGTVRLSSLKGSVVFLNFWATWCPPCRSEMPSMQVLYDRFRNSGLQFVVVDIMEDDSDVSEFLDYFDLTFPVALDENGSVSDRYGVEAIPTTFIIDKNSNIIIQARGSRDWNTPEMFKAFEELLRYGG
jgi:peroxiredoxin